ncbi:hypothetical protein GCM10011376_11810 [Nocardioides flavus (ex Wang et al. 2016)]|uniref:DUF5667 domain-containing protein n=1 Tax=Nocardioides flavus (ex Wang et al. 2016) TaxID=2058780 RepID=A0ABQ3HG77_9ACTN|nr:DUF5667 domain-containing protein [Nocardioides flavus (ex Wang et al. 2016)]GHE16571.1 hypothetical protein GCM10011376_11810 [Nocardioides flavus (ex Wang et al. 2016)]
MTPAFSARRRADEFEALLSRDPDAPLTGRDAERFSALLDVVADLRAVPQPVPRTEFVSSLRERLMEEADTVLVRQPPAPERLAMPAASRTRQRRLGALLGGAALVGSAATMAVAAQTALPGESLYGVKRGIESAQVRLATDDAARGRALLAQAGTRLTEVEELAAGDAGEQLLADTLDSFTRQSGDGVRTLLTSYESTGREDDAQDARDFTTSSMERLAALEDQLPESARDELVAAGRTLSDLDLEISNTCRACTGDLTTVPDFLLASAPTDLLAGLDTDDLTLEAAPISGQDLTGITVPEELDPQQPVPTAGLPSAPVPTPTPPGPTATESTTIPPTTPVEEVTETVTETVTGTTGGVLGGVDGATGGAVGGLTTDIDNATGGLIGEVTGSIDGATGGTLGEGTGGLLP